MSKTTRNRRTNNGRSERHISIRAIRRDPPDLRKLSRAVITLAMAEAEAAKQAQAITVSTTEQTSEDGGGSQ